MLQSYHGGLFYSVMDDTKVPGENKGPVTCN